MSDPDAIMQAFEGRTRRREFGDVQETAVDSMVAALERRDLNIDEEEFAARYVGQKTVEGEPAGFQTRALLSLLGDTFEEREAAFLELFPGGEITAVPSTDIVLYRENVGQKWRKLDQGFFESLAQGHAGRELAGEAGEFLGEDALNLIGEALAFVGKRPGTGGVLRSLLRQTLGGAAGEAVQQATQEVAGTQRESLGEQATRVAGEGGISLVGGTVGEGITRGARLARKQGFFAVSPEGAQAIRAARRAGLPEPLPIQVVESPLIRRLGQQAAALLPRINRAVRAQQQALNKAVRGRVDRRARRQVMNSAERAFDDQSRRVLDLLSGAIRTNPRSARQAALDLRRVVDSWWRQSGQTVDALYRTAREIEEPRFDLAPARKAAERIRGGVVGRGREIEAETGLLDAAGRPLMASRTPKLQIRDLDPTLRKEIDRLLSLDQQLPGGGEGFSSATDVLREIERNLRDLSLPGPEGARQVQLQARELRGAIQDVLDNPVNEAGEFVSAWKQARRAAARRFTTREQAAVMDLVLATDNFADTPTRFMDQLIRPGSADSLVALSRAGGRDALSIAQNRFKTHLMNDPFAITKTLDAYDEPTLRLLVPPSERGAIRAAGKAFDKLERTGIREAMEKQTQTQAFVRQLIDRSDTAGVDALFDLVQASGGLRDGFGTRLRSAIIDEIWNRSNVVERGFRRLSSKKLDAALDQFKERGLLKFLTFEEKKFLRNAERVQRIADINASEVGASLMASSAAAGIRTLQPGAISTLLENIGVGRLMTSDSGRRLLIGFADGKPMDSQSFRILSSLGTRMLIDHQRDRGPEFIESTE